MSEGALTRLQREITGCRLCPRLVEWREQVAAVKRASFAGEEYWGRPVPAFGDARATLVVGGLAPAAHGGNRTGRMFTGDRSGDWLWAALWKAGLANQPVSRDRADGLKVSGAWVTAVVRCAPPANRPTTEERDTCARYLARELELLEDARAFLALGSFAYESLCRLTGTRPRPRFSHGLQARLADGRWVVCSYHPSQQNTFTGRLTREMLDDALAAAVALAKEA